MTTLNSPPVVVRQSLVFSLITGVGKPASPAIESDSSDWAKDAGIDTAEPSIAIAAIFMALGSFIRRFITTSVVGRCKTSDRWTCTIGGAGLHSYQIFLKNLVRHPAALR
jgi:hypothetical protein